MLKVHSQAIFFILVSSASSLLLAQSTGTNQAAECQTLLLAGMHVPQCYAAKCDGSTDDTAAVQAAIDAAKADGKNDVLISGTCAVDQIRIHDHTDLHGGILKKLPDRSTRHMIVLSAPTDRDWKIRDIELVGNKSQKGVQEDAIHLDFASDDIIHRGRIEHVYIHGHSGNGLVMIHSGHGSGTNTVMDVYAESNALDGFLWGVDDSYCVRCEAAMNGYDGFFITGWTTHITNSKAWMNGLDGYEIKNNGWSILTSTDSQANKRWGFNIGNSVGITVVSSAVAQTQGDAGVHLGGGVKSSVLSLQSCKNAAPVSLSGSNTNNQMTLTSYEDKAAEITGSDSGLNNSFTMNGQPAKASH
jgi:hypothetical protein